MNQKTIGEQIANGRKAKGLSRAQFAKALFVSKQAVGKWERGESLPDILMLGKIGEAIGTTDICYFLGKQKVCCACEECKCCGTYLPEAVKKGGSGY